MREILFRGKRSDRKWAFGSLLKVTYDGTTYNLIFADNFLFVFGQATAMGHAAVIPETVGQFTGLTDKNGKKIFEGDIISYIMPDEGSAKGIIKCGEYGTGGSCHVGFGVYWYNRHDTGWLRTDLGFWAKFREIEVIGNIHDNPELLEVE